MGAKVLIAILLILSIGAVVVGITGWNLESDVEMSGHGYAAMAIGIVASLVVGIGLMTLVFYSSRRGYDEAAGRDRHRAPDDENRTVSRKDPAFLDLPPPRP
jgi:hypothetical protein